MTAPSQQKLKVRGSVVVTANRLADGAVVYWTRDGLWTTKLAEALVMTSPQEAKEMLGKAAADDIGAVGAYVAPVEVDGSDVKPGNLRERIRVHGPTFDLPVTFGI